jgi:hypothetical protein
MISGSGSFLWAEDEGVERPARLLILVPVDDVCSWAAFSALAFSSLLPLANVFITCARTNLRAL